MFCVTARKLISQEMDGMLPARRTRALEEHVGRCSACRSYRGELETGRRLLRTTAAEPSETFSWTLQLKLNRAMQGSVASSAVPWVDSAHGSSGWLRSFALSSLAGVALATVVAVWVLPLEQGPLPAAGDH
ncbi:zf-HC2 domain-containing protein, partial [bacterium]|nr:zf-HC2 domain-containing protein [bacterium]